MAVVDEQLARFYWPNESALGKRINTNGAANDRITVVGVVGYVHSQRHDREGEPQLYLPLAALDDWVRRTLSPQRFNTVLISGFAFLALAWRASVCTG